MLKRIGELMCGLGWHRWEKLPPPCTTLWSCVRCRTDRHFHEWKHAKGGYVEGPFNRVMGARMCDCGIKQFLNDTSGYDGVSSEWQSADVEEWERARLEF